MKTIAVTNQKGGVGKSTMAFELGDAARLLGLRVLVVDGDPQGNLTSTITRDELPVDVLGLADVLAGEATIDEALVPGLWDGLTVLPTVGTALTVVRNALMATAEPGREHRLSAALRGVSDQFDLVIIDCPPSLDQLTINALTAANGVLIVTEAKLWATDGIAELLKTIGLVREHLNPSLGIEGILVNKTEEKTKSNTWWVGELRAYATQEHVRLFDKRIPKRIALADSVESRMSLTDWTGGNAQELAELFTEIIKEIAA